MNYNLSQNHKFVIYCFDDCPFCDDAFSLMSDLDLSFRKITVDSESDVWRELKSAYNHKTAPMIFRNHDEDLYELVGGLDDLKEYLNYYQEENDSEEEE
jgi:glutaredoxin